MKPILLSLFLSLFVSLADGQKLYQYNHSDTLVERITAPYFLSEKLVYFDSSFIKVFESGYSQFKIGRVCQEIGCIGEFSETGKTQSGWWQFENKIILCYLTGMENGRFKTELLIYRYDPKIRKFVLLL